MAGMPGRSGGPRAGCEKPRLVGSVRWRLEQRRARASGAVAVPAVPAAVRKPRHLSAAHAAIWDTLAPHAVAAGTLTPATAWAFAQLCDLIGLSHAVRQRIGRDGLMDADGAHPLLARHVAFVVRVEAGLTRFRLQPLGKPLAVPDAAVDPFAEFDRPRVVQPQRKQR